MMSKFAITRTSEDGLSETMWSFCLLDLTIVLDGYLECTRPSKRHKFVAGDRMYVRLSGRKSTISVDQVPLPDDVQAEARKYIVDQIQVVREYRPFEVALKSAPK